MTEWGVCTPWRETVKDGDTAPVNLVCKCILDPLGGERTLADVKPTPALSGSDSDIRSALLLLAMRS